MELNKIGEILPEDPVKFIEDTNVIPVDIQDIRVDLVVAGLPFEKEAIERSRSIDFFGVAINVCSPEDLVIQKAVSVRDKDWMDIQYIIKNMKDELDWPYIIGHCRDLAGFLNDPEILNRINRYRNGH